MCQMRVVKQSIIFIVLSMLFISCEKEESIRESITKPNIIFIYADDWGLGDLGCYGSTFCKTPNLDKMALEGSCFTNFAVVNPVCSPSRTAVMTGNFPAIHGVHGHFATVKSHIQRNMPDWLSPDITLLPKVLKDGGYRTAHFGKWHLSNTHVSDAPSPLEYGYDEFGCFNISSNFRQMSADSTIYRTMEFIENNRDKPLFVNAWIHATHTPHYPKEQYLKQFSYLNEQQQVYASIIADADYKIGLLFDKLKELNLDKNTIVVFSSDNGPEITGDRIYSHDNSTGPGLSTHFSVGETAGLDGQKHSIFAGGVRVPFLVRWPGVVPVGRVDSTTALSSVDILPTFADLAGVTLPENYRPDGESIVKALKGESFKRDKIIYWQWKSAQNRPYFWANAGIQEDNWRLLINRELGKQELYNIGSDWGEKIDVIESNIEKAEELLLKLDKWEKSLPAHPSPDCFSSERESF